MNGSIANLKEKARSKMDVFKKEDQTKIILAKINMSGSSFSADGGLRWTAQINGKFIKWKYKIRIGEEMLCLREAVLELQDKFGSSCDIVVRAYIDSQIGYRDFPVEFYIEHQGYISNMLNVYKIFIEYREKKIKEERQKVDIKDTFGFLMLGEE